ncbi:MAG: MFS transporter, partial [Leptospirales bacterium]
GPPLILGWFAGAYCDRWSPGKILVYSQLSFVLSGLALLTAIEYFVSEPAIRVVLILVAAGFAGIGWSFIAPARFAAVGQLVSPERLHGATVVLNTFSMIGFGLAPLIISNLLINSGWASVSHAIIFSFILATLLLALSPTHGTNKVHQGVVIEIKEGVAALQSNRLLFQLLVSAIILFSVIGPMQVILPKLASTELLLSEKERGLFLGILALALITGGALCMILRNKLHDGKTILYGSVLAGGLVMALSQLKIPEVSSVVLLMAGLIFGIIGNLIVAGMQEVADHSVRGRIMSMYTITSQCVPAFSGLFAGILSHFLGGSLAFLICGMLVFVMTSLNTQRLSLLRGFNRLDAKPISVS